MRRALAFCVMATLAACSGDREADARSEADAAWRAHTEIVARATLMAEMQVQMLEIDKAAIGESFDLRSARVRAGAISAMLGALPFLFSEGTDSETTADRPTPSLALPAIWEDRAAFDAMAERIRLQASALVPVSEEDIFRARAATLRAGCNACHAAYQKGYLLPDEGAAPGD